MRRPALYSQSRAARAPQVGTVSAPARQEAEAPAAGASGPALGALRRLASRQERFLLFAAGALLVAIAMFASKMTAPMQRAITQKDIDRAVLHTLANEQLPSPAAKAAEAVRESVVRVRGIEPGERGDADIEEGVGTGVVIVDSGIILTNLHVAQGAEKIQVTFADGSESEATVISTQPEHDLAVLRVKAVPDDLKAATLRSTGDLAPGDQVVAVGFPFGIGPSVSYGVVSGLQREFRSPQGKRVLTNLIQFDAAANPGNSGGPLVTMDGEVVGIVTAILNPTRERVFIGIGFAVPIENAAAGVGVHPF